MMKIEREEYGQIITLLDKISKDKWKYNKELFKLGKFRLKNACKYSFKDLVRACGLDDNYTDYLQGLSHLERNKEIKRLCDICHWYYKDVVKDGKLFTSFSPEWEIEN